MASDWIDSGSGPGYKPKPTTATPTAPTERYAFGVITRVADPATSGNLAAELDLYVETVPCNKTNNFVAEIRTLADVMGAWFLLALRKPVFSIGEILILDGNGREIGYPGRKPSKWDVECEEFDTLADAANRAREVLGL